MAVGGSTWRLRLPGDHRLRRVLLAYGLSAFTEFATWLAILLVAYEQGGPVMAGIAAFSMQVPAMVLVPILAGFGDRIPRGRALALTHAAVAGTALATGLLLVFGAPLWAVLVGGSALTIAVSLVRPMHFAAIPLLTRRPGDLVAANGLSSFLDGASVFLGFVLAGVITDAVGAWAVLMVGAGLGLVATALTSGLGTPVAAVAHQDAPSQVRAALAGVATLRRSPGAVMLLALMAITSVVEGANDTLTVTFNDEVLGLPASTAGVIAGAYGVGVAVGGMTQAGMAHRPRLAPVVLAGALLLGLAQASVALVGSLAPAAGILALVGFGVSMIQVSSRTLLQRTTNDAVLTRVMAIEEGVRLVGLTLGALVGPLLVITLGPSAAFVPLGLLIASMGLASLRAIRALDRTAVIRQREVDLLAGVPFLGSLPPYQLERLAQGAAWQQVPAGAAVVTQGEVGDAFYLVGRGELSVAVDGTLREHTLTVGDGFGEIALLEQVPRTATVAALTDSDLLVIDSEQFLTVVASSGHASAAARRLAQGRLAADARRDPPGTSVL